jgi:hypothetical protein
LTVKKFFKTLFFIVMIGCCLGRPVSARAQQPLPPTQYYEAAAGSDDAESVVRELESRFSVYNKLFRFDPSLIKSPLKVRVIRDTKAYDEYVSARLGGSLSGAVYLHYREPDRRELVINRFSIDEKKALPYQAFIQYLKAFIPDPPSWMKEGFASYFNTLLFSPAGELVYEENLSWLPAAKNLGAKTPPEAILLADKQGFPENFQSLSWALVSFFLNSGNEDYFRSLVESFMVLSSTASAAENAEAAAKRFFLWSDAETMKGDYLSYLASRKTFLELMEEGQKAYAAKDPAMAELAFSSALNQKPGHYAPYYYLGLIAYENNRFTEAEQLYLFSLQYGADRALVSYALGINAASAGRNKDAVDFLRQAAEAAPEKYREKAESLILRLK